MNAQTLSLASVEKFLQARGDTLALPASLEDQYERDTRGRRAAFLRDTALFTCLVFNLLFVPGTWLIEPDVTKLAIALDLFAVTPWTLFVALLVGRPVDKRLREAAAASVPVVIAAAIIILSCLTESAYAVHACYFVLMAIIGGNTVLRLRNRHAIFASACSLAIAMGAVVACGRTPGHLAALQGVLLAGCAFATLAMNRIRERDIRRAYLRTLRDRLKIAEADAQAKKDPLTDLGNRRHLAARAAELWSAGDDFSPVAAIMLDIDHFKEFNDRYGHPEGDACLKRVAACVTAELRNLDDFAIRYGGEELLMMLPKTDLGDAIRVAERIRRSIEALAVPHAGSPKFGVVTASFGVSAGQVSAMTPDEMIASADAALYTAKRGGRNQVCPPPLRDATVGPARTGWAAALKRKAS